LAERKIEICDRVLERLEKSFDDRKAWAPNLLFGIVERGLLDHPFLETDPYVMRYVRLIFQYEGRYRD